MRDNCTFNILPKNSTVHVKKKKKKKKLFSNMIQPNFNFYWNKILVGCEKKKKKKSK